MQSDNIKCMTVGKVRRRGINWKVICRKAGELFIDAAVLFLAGFCIGIGFYMGLTLMVYIR